MKASLGGMSFQISRLIHWNKTMLFQNINSLTTHKEFYLCNMIYHRCWTIIIFVINVAIILIDRRHSGVLPVLLKGTRLKGFIYHICLWYRNIWGWFSPQNEVHAQYIIIGFIRWRSQICFDIFFGHLIETKNMNTFGAFPETIVIKILKFLVHFVANVGKKMIEIIRRNVTTNMRVLIFTRYESFNFLQHFWVISAECMNIIEIDILSLLDNTCYLIP